MNIGTDALAFSTASAIEAMRIYATSMTATGGNAAQRLRKLALIGIFAMTWWRVISRTAFGGWLPCRAL
jgi:hypothetical protein